MVPVAGSDLSFYCTLHNNCLDVVMLDQEKDGKQNAEGNRQEAQQLLVVGVLHSSLDHVLLQFPLDNSGSYEGDNDVHRKRDQSVDHDLFKGTVCDVFIAELDSVVAPSQEWKYDREVYSCQKFTEYHEEVVDKEGVVEGVSELLF